MAPEARGQGSKTQQFNIFPGDDGGTWPAKMMQHHNTFYYIYVPVHFVNFIYTIIDLSVHRWLTAGSIVSVPLWQLWIFILMLYMTRNMAWLLFGVHLSREWKDSSGRRSLEEPRPFRAFLLQSTQMILFRAAGGEERMCRRGYALLQKILKKFIKL
jgi:hypothetical protein